MFKIYLVLLSLVFVGCGQNIHEHTFYTYKIKYGKSLDHLDKELISICEAYVHPSQYEEKCYKKINKIDGYICALDNRLYLINTYRGGSGKHRYSSSSIQILDNIYCKIEDTIIIKKTFNLIENNTFSPDVEEVITDTSVVNTSYTKYLQKYSK